MTTLTSALLSNAVMAACLAAVVMLLSRSRFIRRRPGLGLLLWMVVLLKLVTPPLFEIRLPIFIAREGFSETLAAEQLARLSAEMNEIPQVQHDSRGSFAIAQMNWAGAFLGISLLGSLLLFVDIRRQGMQVARILRFGAPQDRRLSNIVSECSQLLGIDSAPTTCVVSARISPMLWVRLPNPVIVLPRDLVTKFNDEQLRCVICHEIAHWIRRDHWVNLFSLWITVLCWWNPVAWWARREVQLGQELCCDSLVLDAASISRREYAETLYSALEFTQPDRALLPALGSGFGGRFFVRRRFQMIADQRLQHRWSWQSWPLLIAGALVLPWALRPTIAGEIQFSDCPKAVQQTIQREAGSGQVGEISSSRENELFYQAVVVIDALEYELKIAADGTLLCKVLEQHSEDDERAIKLHRRRHETEMRAESWANTELGGKENGNGGQVKFDDLPKAIRTALKHETHEDEIEEIFKSSEDGPAFFEVVAEIDERDYEIKYSKDGMLLSKTLADKVDR